MAAKDAMSLQSSSRGDEVGIDQARSDGIEYSHTTENDMGLQEVVVPINRILQLKKPTFAYMIRKPVVAFFFVFFCNITCFFSVMSSPFEALILVFLQQNGIGGACTGLHITGVCNKKRLYFIYRLGLEITRNPWYSALAFPPRMC